MYGIQIALPAETAAQQTSAENKAGTVATGFPSILSGVQLSSGDAAEGSGRSVQRLLMGGGGKAGLEMKKANGEGGGLASLLGGAFLRAGEGDGEGQGQKVALLTGKDGAEHGTAQSASVRTFKLMPLRPAEGHGEVGQLIGKLIQGGEQKGGQTGAKGADAQSSEGGSEGAKQVRWSLGLVVSTSGDGTARQATDGAAKGQKTVPLTQGGSEAEGNSQRSAKQGQSGNHGKTAGASQSSGTKSGRATRVQVSSSPVVTDAGEGQSNQRTEGQTSKKGQTSTMRGAAKQMPEGGRAGASGQNGSRAQVQGSSLFEAGKSRLVQKAGGQSTTNSSNADGQVRGDAGQTQDAGVARGTSAGKEGAQGKTASLLSVKGKSTESGSGREAVREAFRDGRSARTTHDGRFGGRQARGRTGQQGGRGHQKGGHQGQSAGQNGTGQNSPGAQGQGQGAKSGSASQVFSSSVTNSSASGESDARALRASLTRDGASTGSGTQGTDGKGTGTSGASSGTATKSAGRAGGGSGPPRTMPSAWLNAAKQGPLRTAELAGGWKALEMSLGEDKGTMTVRARQGQEQTAVTVGFSETRVQAQVVANARQLQEAMQSQYGTDVDLSFGGGNANESDREAPDGTTADRASSRASGNDATDEDSTGTSTLRSRGRREWVG